MRILLSAAILALILCSCKKQQGDLDPPVISSGEIANSKIIINESCDSLKAWPYPKPVGWSNFIGDSIACEYPSINPNNPLELIFVKTTIGKPQPELVIYNLVTGSQRVIHRGDVRGYKIDWGRNGWILFREMVSSQSSLPLIFKIKQDGTGLTQLTFGAGKYFDGIGWTYTADRYFYVRDMNTLVVKQTNTDVTIDSLPFAYAASCNQFDQVVGLAMMNGNLDKVIYDLKTKAITDISQLSLNRGIYYGDMTTWMPDGKQIIYVSPLGFGIYDVATNSSKTIYENNCKNRSYACVSVSPNLQRVITYAYKAEPLPDTPMNKYSYKIRVLKFDGTDEREIVIK